MTDAHKRNAAVRFKELSQEFLDITEQATIIDDKADSKKTPGSGPGTLPGTEVFLKTIEAY